MASVDASKGDFTVDAELQKDPLASSVRLPPQPVCWPIGRDLLAKISGLDFQGCMLIFRDKTSENYATALLFLTIQRSESVSNLGT